MLIFVHIGKILALSLADDPVKWLMYGH